MGRFDPPLSPAAATPAALCAALILTACGDSGGGAVDTTAVPAGDGGPTWTAGVFEPASDFKDLCEVVRTGVDIEGDAFPDQPGSLAEENFWLRSWTHETYLWNDEVVDQDPRDFEDRLDYFAVLRTTEVTPSGEDKDDFHFSQPTEEYLRQRNLEAEPGYGAALIAFSTVPPRDYRVAYTEPNSPASLVVAGSANLIRGSRILEVDGVDLVNGGATQAEIDTLNAGLFPETVGERHSFVVQDPGAATTRTISMTAADIAPAPVNRTAVIDTPAGPVGYILFNTFSPFQAEQDIAEAMSLMQASGITDLVLDLRYNGGGLLAVASQLSYMVAGPARTAGKTFELLQFNADAGNRNPVTGEFNDPLPFYSTGLGFSLVNGAPLTNVDLGRVFILSTEGTCSASEA
ncbi:MAG: S41 family peptidase, partial [Caulobacterales bacterium]|nr:S41 family peptidase [Caulobacterales bacterium]